MYRIVLKIFNKSNLRIKKMIITLLVKFGEKEPWNEDIRQLFKECLGIQVGYGTYGTFNIGDFPRGSVIGNYCSISSNVKCFAENHPIRAVSMHPLFYEKEFGLSVEDIRERTNLTVGHGCWIGYGVIITSGCCEIGNGAIVGAGAVVTKNIPPYAIVAGCPAKIIGYRFEEHEIMKIEQSKWWYIRKEEYDSDIAAKVMNVDAFCKVVTNEKN